MKSRLFMLKAQIDWLEFTVLETSISTVLELLNLEWNDFTALAKGRFGYNTQYKWNSGHIYIMFSAQSEKIDETVRIKESAGVHVMLTGQGCKQYAANHDLINVIKILSQQERVNFSRIDLAVDDLESQIISYDKIHEAAISGLFTSRWTKWDEVVSRQASDNRYLGRTMYFGSQASDLFCRVYDKSLERKVNAPEEQVPERWTRLEIVYRKDRAKKLVEHLINGKKSLGSVLRGTLKRYIRFLLPSTDQNKARWPSAPWWEKLLSGVEALQLTIEKESKTIDDMRSWVDKQIAPTLSAIIKAHEGDLGWLRSTIVKGSKRLSKRHKEAILQYLEGEPA